MDAQQIADLMAERNLEFAALLGFIASRPALVALCANDDLIIQFRKGHVLPTIKYAGQATVEPVQLQAEPTA